MFVEQIKWNCGRYESLKQFEILTCVSFTSQDLCQIFALSSAPTGKPDVHLSCIFDQEAKVNAERVILEISEKNNQRSVGQSAESRVFLHRRYHTRIKFL